VRGVTWGCPLPLTTHRRPFCFNEFPARSPLSYFRIGANCSRLSCRRNTIASKASNDAIGVHARAHRRRRTPCATLLTCQNSHPYLSDLRTQRITSMKKAQTSIRLLAPSKPRIPNRSRRGSSEADCAPVSKTYVPNTSINQNPQNPAAKAQNRQVDTVRLLMLPRSATEDNSHPQIRRPH